MSKPFMDIHNQIALLQSRGLVFNDVLKAERFLLTNNYYNVINCFSRFLIDHDNIYMLESTFDEITQIHYFDKEVKSVLFKNIIEIEKHLRSLVSYYFSQHHSNQPYCYLITSNYQQNDLLAVANITSEFSKILSTNIKHKTNPIYHYTKTHNDVPMWVLSNSLSFRTLVRFYTLMLPNEQNLIAREFSSFLSENLGVQNSLLQVDELISILNNLVELRNTIAHNNRLLGLCPRYNINYIHDLHSAYNIVNASKRQDVYNIFIAMQACLTKNQYANLHNTILSRAKKLNRHINSVSYTKVLACLGFPANWHATSKRAQ